MVEPGQRVDKEARGKIDSVTVYKRPSSGDAHRTKGVPERLDIKPPMGWHDAEDLPDDHTGTHDCGGLYVGKNGKYVHISRGRCPVRDCDGTVRYTSDRHEAACESCGFVADESPTFIRDKLSAGHAVGPHE